ncbi:MAG: Aerotolerance protein BatA [Parcubacteria group bacterium GW2011_GWA2_44_12]|nr:MAG: Aerotolerance protein BatA [Parcubacteria group bacterium GW2011_GWA2_44_12]
MRFLHPNFLWLLGLIPALAIFYAISLKEMPAFKVGSFFGIKAVFKKSRVGALRHIVFGLRLAAIAFAIIILARPQTGSQKIKTTKQGIDIIIAFDVSSSMLAEDLKPNRISAAKETVKQFIKGVETDRIGLVVFAGRAFTQAPLTFDYDILIQYLEEMSTESINQNVRGLNGTGIGNALSAALFKLEKSQDRSKVIILLTDGQSNTGLDPLLVARLAGEKGVKIYTIGIGSIDGALVPYTDQFGQKHYVQNADGSFQKSSVDEKTLKNIAELTGGAYYRADDNEKFSRIFQKISRLEKKDIEISRFTRYKEGYEVYAWSLLAVFLAEFVLRRTVLKVYA